MGEGRCLSYGEGITYWPLSQAIRQLAGIAETDPKDLALRKLAALSEGSVDAASVVDRVSTAMGLAEAPFSKEEIAWGFRKLLEHVAADHPLVIVFDDIQWAEPTLLEAVASVAIAGNLRTAPVRLFGSTGIRGRWIGPRGPNELSTAFR